MGNIYLLDCTLRDGGFALEDTVNYESKVKTFSIEQQREIIKNLTCSNIDFIEIGALEQGKDIIKSGFAIYKNMEDISLNISEFNNSSKYAVFFRGPDIPIDEVPVWTPNLCKIIRLCVRYSEIRKSLEYCKELTKKGYHVFIQPMVTSRYTEEEINLLIEAANEMGAYALYFVDSYGYMTYDDVSYYYNLFNDRLAKEIKIGFHSHNNINMAFANVQYFIEISKKSDRDIVIDSTCMGMGQGAGNIQTELIVDYLNKIYKNRYDFLSILKACETVDFFHTDNIWGYSLVRLLSAINRTAYKFSVSLRKVYHLRYTDIYNLLKDIPEDIRHRYSRENVEKLLTINGFSVE